MRNKQATCRNMVTLPLRGAWNKEYGETWEFAMISGNGVQGAMVFGNPKQETIIANHCRLFLPKTSNRDIPFMAPYLSELRKVIREQGYDTAQTFYYEKALEQGYDGLAMSDPFHPGFHLHLHFKVEKWENYVRYENFETGEIGVSFIDEKNVHHIRKTFVSRADNVIVHHISNSADNVSCVLEVEQYNEPLLETSQRINGNIIELQNMYVKGRGGYGAAIRIITPEGSISIEGNKVHIHHAKDILLLMKIEPYKEMENDTMAQITSKLEGISLSYAELLPRHQKIHQEIFQRVQLNLTIDEERLRSVEDLVDEAKKQRKLPMALIEKIYDAGRYVFISSSGELTPNLQGIWTGTFTPAWSSDFTFDTNVQLAIASALYCNMNEGLQGFFRLIKEFLPEFRENAQKYYGCRGIMSSIHSSNCGRHFHWNKEWPLQFWTCGAGWLGHWFYEYYLHSGDKNFLRNEAIPYLKECALFYEDFLIEDESGKFRFSPSYSAENGCGDNATQDIAVAKEVLKNLIAAHDELGIETEERKKWESMLQRLPAYMINEEGALKEWAAPEKEENYNHRHFSHLYPIFQSREFTKESEPELWAASEVAFEKRLEAWMRNDSGDTSSTHGRMHAGLCATRLGKKDVAYEVMQTMVLNNSMYLTLATSHYNNYDVFNVDGNGAMPQIINEMLLYGDVGKITLLGALPDVIESGEVSGISLPKQIKVNTLKWNLSEKNIEMTITSKINQEIIIEAPLFPALSVRNFRGCAIEQRGAKAAVGLVEQKTADIIFTF